MWKWKTAAEGCEDNIWMSVTVKEGGIHKDCIVELAGPGSEHEQQQQGAAVR
ncbi:hypothetical protein ACSS6W_007977 [Trichoderma asperelloides]